MQEENIKPKKVGHIKRGWLVTKSAWTIFKLDKELSLFAFISGIVAPIVALAGWLLGLYLSPNHSFDTNNMHSSPQAFAVWVASLAIIYLITTYASAAIIASALMRFRGEDPTIKDGISAVKKRFGSLTIFALFNMGIAQGLQYIQNRVPFAGKVVTFLAQLAWSIASIFAIPVIVDSKESVGPIKAVKLSGGIIKKTWAETAVSNLSVGTIFFGIAMLEIAVSVSAIAVASRLISNDIVDAVLAGIMVIALFATIIVATALSSIVKAAVYHFATTGETPENFSNELMKQAFTTKKARKIFA